MSSTQAKCGCSNGEGTLESGADTAAKESVQSSPYRTCVPGVFAVWLQMPVLSIGFSSRDCPLPPHRFALAGNLISDEFLLKTPLLGGFVKKMCWVVASLALRAWGGLTFFFPRSSMGVGGGRKHWLQVQRTCVINQAEIPKPPQAIPGHCWFANEQTLACRCTNNCYAAKHCPYNALVCSSSTRCGSKIIVFSVLFGAKMYN